MDKEIIRVTERVNIFRMTFSGSILKVFPVLSSKNHKWVSWNDDLAFAPDSDVLGTESFFNIDPEAVQGQVPYMPDRGHDIEGFAQVALQRTGFSGRLNNY